MGRKFGRFWKRTANALGAVEFWLTPGRVARRRTAQNRLKFQERMLSSREIADDDRFRGARWLTSRLSPDSELEADLETIRDRCEDLYLNNPVAAAYVKDRVVKVVGTGPTFQSRIREGQGISADRAKMLNEEREALFLRWAKKADITGRKSLWSRLRLAQRCFDKSGEALVVLSDKEIPGKPIPLAIEVVAVNRLATPPEQEGKQNVRLGIEREQDGTPIAYFIRTVPPNDTKQMDDRYERVPADRVIHLYEEEEPGQSRGYPGMAPSAGTLKDQGDLDEAVIVGRQVKACFSVFVPAVDPLDAAAVAAYATDSAGNRLEKISPGAINYYNPTTGDKPSFAEPSGGGGEDLATYQELQYHKIAAGMNWPYEALMKTYGNANYSSARTVRLDGDEVTNVAQKRLDEELLAPIVERFTLEAVIAGELSIAPGEYLDRADAFNAYQSIPTGRPWVDPLKEAKADAEAVSERFKSRGRIVRNHDGLDDDELQEEILREQMRDADRELILKKHRQKLGLDQKESGEPVGAGAEGVANDAND